MTVVHPVGWRTPTREGECSALVLAQFARKRNSPQRMEPMTSGYVVFCAAQALWRILNNLLLRHICHSIEAIDQLPSHNHIGHYGTLHVSCSVAAKQENMPGLLVLLYCTQILTALVSAGKIKQHILEASDILFGWYLGVEVKGTKTAQSAVFNKR